MKTKNFIHLTLTLLLFTLSFVAVGAVSAQKPTPSDDEVNAIARQLFCPVCENTPLDVCPTAACRDWRELIRQMLAEGKTSDEIKQYFVDHYGARVLSEPPWAGLSWLVYVVPPVAFLIGVFLLIRALHSWRKIPQEPNASKLEPTGDNEYVSRLEEDLRKRL